METALRLSREERLQLQADILHSLWYEGAASALRLADRLGRSSDLILECLQDLTDRHYIYIHWPSTEGALQSVYYLRWWLRRAICQILKDSPRYRMRLWWELLCREEAGLPNPERIAHVAPSS
ncbi:hypothetical protein LM602_07205 [Candidatus Acetothermia bacterium]|nr:hypothetical protein [Candidatus Acetothermia bacterium]MCI2432322.1 hypothetical protein [Candidatus Acetothermia bacterium]MCI2437311.1 hypothetical protein [Candidatus Acetothermia bacterium]